MFVKEFDIGSVWVMLVVYRLFVLMFVLMRIRFFGMIVLLLWV